MNNTFYNILIGLSAFIIGVLAFADEIGKRSAFNFIKSFLFKIIAFILASFIGIWATVEKDSNTEIKSEKDKVEAKIDQSKRDSILKEDYDISLLAMKQKYDSNSIKTIFTMADILGKYGFKLDSTNKTLIKLIRDSSKTKVIMPDDPVLSLCPTDGIKIIDHKNGRYFAQLALCSYDASSTSYDLKCHTALADSSANLFYIGTVQPIEKTAQISKDVGIIVYFNFQDDLVKNYSFIYILVKGTYKNFDKTKTFDIGTLFYYNFNGKTTGEMWGKTRETIIAFMKNYQNDL